MSHLRISTLLGIIAFLFMMATSTAIAQLPSIPTHRWDGYIPNEIVVRLNPHSGATVDEINDQYGTETIKALAGSDDLYLLRTPDGVDAADLAFTMRSFGSATLRLRYVEPNFMGGVPEANPKGVSIWGGEDDAPLTTQYAPDMLNLTIAHTTSQGNGITIAIIDTGIQADHPALADVLVAGYDFIDGDDDPTDEQMGINSDDDDLTDEAWGHGTHVAGIIHQTAPQASIMPIRALDSDGGGDIFAIGEAIRYATEQGVDVINLSLGTESSSDYLNERVIEAIEQGIVVVAAAGNLDTTDEQYPAALPQVIAVTSIDENSLKAPSANYGTWVDISAPGESIYSPMPPNGYAWWSGTSMATPFIAGGAALLLESGTAPHDVLSTMQASTLNINTLNPDYTGGLGAGQANMGTAIYTQGTAVPPTSITVSHQQVGQTNQATTIGIVVFMIGLMTMWKTRHSLIMSN